MLEGRAMKVCAVVVTYRPDLQLLARMLNALAGQVDQVLILDNASPSSLVPVLETVPVRHHRCVRNRGLGWTQNLGARWAWRAGFDAVLLMDQDSVPHQGMVDTLIGVAGHPQLEPLAAVSPRPADAFHGRLFPIVGNRGGSPSGPWTECAFMISSGMLISKTAWRAIGGMRAELFIDHIDTEWCLRARAAGWRLVVASQAVLEHRLGDGGQWLWIGRWRWFPHHSPLRHYYMVRNSIWLSRQTELSRAIRHRLWSRPLGVVLFSLLLLPQRGERLRRVIQACQDASAGVMGPINGVV